jgi:branched-chain amino acid transport system permease protein
MPKLKKSLGYPLLCMAIAIAAAPLIDMGFNAYIKLTIIYICVNIILAASLNLVNGFTGQFSLGHAGFMAVGAYTSAVASMHIQFLPPPFEAFQFPIYTLIGGGAAALAGYFVGLPSLRLKGDYLAIVTLGFGEIIRVLILNIDYIGGARGMYGIPTIQDSFASAFDISFVMAMFWVLVCLFTISRLIRSTHGRGFLSVREDEVAAEAMGINTTQMKVRSFVLSSFFAGVAGSIFAHYAAYLNPATFSFMKSVDAIIMVVLGGMGSLTGSIVAAAIVTILPEALRPLQEYTGVDLRMVIYALALILLMILRPKGLFGTKELADFFPKRSKEAS